ncbi:tetratricopeptide repeat protein [Polyangium aurulentum]|uniref:tetratricopeptide repeat protein n=1 Tax=Polyangium aurulentum TaxID=2567896 RepID=UPI0010AEDD70|nr:tetratricopeptide repeat protein [Polyangium aurulentum]UQA63346.1 tetratricopeptide repeat protein [Polyangium aurulentum]
MNRILMHLRAPVGTALAFIPALLCLAAPASAQPAQAAPTSAELLEKARVTLAAGNTASACRLFEDSHAARTTEAAGTPGPTPAEIMFEIAACHEKQGNLDQAAFEFDQVAAAAGARSEEAKGRAAALREKITGLPPPPPAQPAPPGAGTAPIQPPPPFSVPNAPATTPAAATPGSPVPALQVPAHEDPPVRVGDFMDTRLTWVFGDDDVLHQTGQALPLSANASISERRAYRLFFDNLNSRFAGRENLTHLALYKKLPGFIKGLDTEASMVLRFDLASLARASNNLNQSIYDAGSFIRAFYHLGGDKNGKRGISLTLYPLDTDRFRLGYLYDISWGGTNPFINQSIFPRIQGAAPGGKVELSGDKYSIYIGLKTATIVQVEQTLTPGTSEVEEIRIGQTNYGVLGGGSFDVTNWLHIDAGGGYFQQGKFDLPDVKGKSVYTGGLSWRVLFHDKDTPTPQSIDFALYRNDPNKPMIVFKPETYRPGKTSWSVALEATNLWQLLKDFDVAGATAVQQARATALQANVKTGFFRGSFTTIYRDLPYVLRNQPSFIPFQTLPRDAATSDEFFLALAADYHFPGPKLTPGIGAGLQLPATFSTATIDQSSAPIERTVVVREQGNIAILPVNQGAVPIFQARASLKWDISPILSAQAWVQYVRDNNGTFVERDPSEGTLALRTFISPNFLGFGTSVAARF